MRTFYTKIIFLAFVLLISCSKKDDTWETIAIGLPDKLDPSVSMLNMGFYLLKQTHEPILRQNSEGNFESRILSKWQRSLDSKTYTLCLKENLLFTGKLAYDKDLFFQDIKKMALEYDPKAQIRFESSCSKVSFNQDSYSFLSTLSDYKNAPTKKVNEKWHLGLGDYKVIELNDKKIVLERKNKVGDGYNKIVFYSYNGPDDPVLRLDGVEDYNRVLLSHLPEKIKQTYNSYPVSLMQTVSLLINVDNIKDREVIYNCVDIDELRKAFFPNQNKFADIQTVLPVGFIGGKKGQVARNCKSTNQYNKEYVFFNWNQENQTELAKYFSSFYKKTGIKITLKNITMSEFTNSVFKMPHPYQLTVVALDAVVEDVRAFYLPLVDRSNRIVDPYFEDEYLLLEKIGKIRNRENRYKYIELFNNNLLNKGIILPLFQEVRYFYYPKTMTGLRLGEDSLEYLRIGELKI